MDETYQIVNSLTWPLMSPVLAFAILLFAVYNARNGKGTTGLVAAAVAILVFGWVVAATSNEYLDIIGIFVSMVLIAGAIYYDMIRFEPDPKVRKRFPALVPVMFLMSGINLFSGIRDFQRHPWKLGLSATALTYKARTWSVSVPRSKIRIIEFDHGTYREWHIKGAGEVISVGGEFISPDGKWISDFELVGRIEKWSERQREYKLPPIYDGGTFLRQP